MVTAAFVVLGILAVLSIFQIALAFGAPIGRFAWGGAHRVLPKKLRAGSAVSLLIYATIAVFVLSKAEIVPLITNETVLAVGLWVVFGYFVVGIGVNAILRSKGERYTMTPICIVLAVAMFFVASAPLAEKPLIFSVDDQKMSGWYSVPNYHSRAEAVKQDDTVLSVDELPVTYRGLFQGKPGSMTDSCFVTYDYYDTPASGDVLLREKLEDATTKDIQLTKYGEKTFVMSTPQGDISYQLHHYKMTLPGQEKYMQGYGYAYVSLEGGHIRISSVCPTVEDLESTVVPMAGVSLTRQSRE